jgi:predicted MFS family arabinose efflux permease
MPSSDSPASSPLGLLRSHAALRRLFIGALISAVGDTLTWTALTWHVVETTNSGAAVGWMLLAFALPTALTGAPLGRFLDRLSPKKLIIADNLARALITVLIPVLGALGYLSLPVLYTLAAIEGALSPVTRAGLRMLVPRLVDDRDLEGANAVMGWTENLPMIVGAPLAGALITAWGALNALYLDAASFLVLAGMLASVKTSPIPVSDRTDEKAPRATPLVLLRYPSVAILTGMSAAFFFAYGPTEAALPLFVKNTHRADALGLGIVWGAVGVGAAVGSAFVGPVSKVAKTGSALAGIALLWGVFQGAFAFTHTAWAGALCFFLGGIAWGPYLVLESTFLQRNTPPEEHGVIFGAHTAALAPVLPLGTALGGLLLQKFSPSGVILGSALASVLASLLGFVLLARPRPSHPS